MLLYVDLHVSIMIVRPFLSGDALERLLKIAQTQEL
jgi:hypothetical protein